MLSAAFLRDTTENLAAAMDIAPIRGYAAYAPRGTEETLRQHIAAPISLVLADGIAPMPPGVEGFGRCLLHAMQGMLSEGNHAACVLSSDIPTLPTRLLADAAEVLLGSNGRASPRMVFGASADGGYYILGATDAHAGLFTDIAWSTDSVAEATRRRARALGLDVVELEPWDDVDDMTSLDAIMGDHSGYGAPHTRATIERLGLQHLMSAPAV